MSITRRTLFIDKFVEFKVKYDNNHGGKKNLQHYQVDAWQPQTRALQRATWTFCLIVFYLTAACLRLLLPVESQLDTPDAECLLVR